MQQGTKACSQAFLHPDASSGRLKSDLKCKGVARVNGKLKQRMSEVLTGILHSVTSTSGSLRGVITG